MTPDWTLYLCLLLGLVTALVGGVFQSFSDFVMAGLVRARPQSGADAMQQLNRTVFRSIFLASFLALVPITIGFGIIAVFQLREMVRVLIVAAAVIYVISVFLVTVAGNVPMNQRLDAMDVTAPETHTYWAMYGRVWTRWNHVRTLGSVATAACYLLAAAML